jgi:hypothetical protein
VACALLRVACDVEQLWKAPFMGVTACYTPSCPQRIRLFWQYGVIDLCGVSYLLSHCSTETKEVRLRPVTEAHDYEVKVASARKFLSKGSKVKLTMQFSGRELRFKDQGKEMMLVSGVKAELSLGVVLCAHAHYKYAQCRLGMQ